MDDRSLSPSSDEDGPSPSDASPKRSGRARRDTLSSVDRLKAQSAIRKMEEVKQFLHSQALNGDLEVPDSVSASMSNLSLSAAISATLRAHDRSQTPPSSWIRPTVPKNISQQVVFINNNRRFSSFTEYIDQTHQKLNSIRVRHLSTPVQLPPGPYFSMPIVRSRSPSTRSARSARSPSSPPESPAAGASMAPDPPSDDPNQNSTTNSTGPASSSGAGGTQTSPPRPSPSSATFQLKRSSSASTFPPPPLFLMKPGNNPSSISALASDALAAIASPPSPYHERTWADLPVPPPPSALASGAPEPIRFASPPRRSTSAPLPFSLRSLTGGLNNVQHQTTFIPPPPLSSTRVTSFHELFCKCSQCGKKRAASAEATSPSTLSAQTFALHFMQSKQQTVSISTTKDSERVVFDKTGPDQPILVDSSDRSG